MMLPILWFISFCFGNEPEAILFMMYIILFIWSHLFKIATYAPTYAPHILDVVAFNSTGSESCAGEITSDGACAASIAQVASSLIKPKYCGKTVGEIAATCGISMAIQGWAKPRERIVPARSSRFHRKVQNDARRRFRKFMSLSYGTYVNLLEDVFVWIEQWKAEMWWDWWQKQIDHADAAASAEASL